MPWYVSDHTIRLPLFPITIIPPKPHRGYPHISCILNDKLGWNHICPSLAIPIDTPFVLAFTILLYYNTVICHDINSSKQ